jgi:hypothetical protein
VLMRYVQQLSSVLPPYSQDGATAAQALRTVPTSHDILKYEYSLLHSLQNTTCVAFERHSVVNTLFEKADVPPGMRLAVLNFLNSRAYTDSALCLQKQREAVIVAAIVYTAQVAAQLKTPAQCWQPPDDLCDR